MGKYSGISWTDHTFNPWPTWLKVQEFPKADKAA